MNLIQNYGLPKTEMIEIIGFDSDDFTNGKDIKVFIFKLEDFVSLSTDYIQFKSMGVHIDL